MTRQVFIQELEKLNQDVIRMGKILEHSIDDMIAALAQIDVSLAEQIIRRDDEIDLLEQQIEKECINMIAKQQPLATDLRKVTSIMKIITDIERIADHCSDISEYILILAQQQKINMPKGLDAMIQAMKKMVIETIDSFVHADLEKASSVVKADDVVDQFFKEIGDELIVMMQEKKEIIPQCVGYLMIIKYLERMGDHATNIAEWIQFIVTGDLVIG